MSRDDPVTPAGWSGFRRFTPARIALGRAGSGLPTGAHLAFQLDHARARDAVHAPLDRPALAADLAAIGLTSLCADSTAGDRATYLRRPDLGRVPAPEVETSVRDSTRDRPDIALVLADGLSPLAVQRHAPALLGRVAPALLAQGLRLSPAILVAQGRVAIGDPIGAWAGARACILLIGERPGLSSPESLGAYLTHDPRPGRTDAERNCVSNIHPRGLDIEAAARTVVWLTLQMLSRQLSGVGLKDRSRTDDAASLSPPR